MSSLSHKIISYLVSCYIIRSHQHSSDLLFSPTDVHRDSGGLHQAGLQGYCSGTSSARVQTLLAQSPEPQQVLYARILR